MKFKEKQKITHAIFWSGNNLDDVCGFLCIPFTINIERYKQFGSEQIQLYINQYYWDNDKKELCTEKILVPHYSYIVELNSNLPEIAREYRVYSQEEFEDKYEPLE